MQTSVTPRRLGVLVSGGGTNLAALCEAIDSDPEFGARVCVVASDRRGAGGLARARERAIPVVVESLDDHADRRAWEAALRRELEEHQVDIIVLAGFMRILTSAFLDGWPDRVVNTHPSLLPAFRGAHAVADALAHGVKITGCTVHLVDEQVDHGPIIAQQAVTVVEDDTIETLHDRIKAVEHRLMPACVAALCQQRLVVDGRRVRWCGPPGTDSTKEDA